MSKTGAKIMIGLETHAQLKVGTKLFCSCSEGETCPTCLGFPGSRPVLAQGAVEKAIEIALALGCDVHERSVFARKTYAYPDLPKGYQITQYDMPLAEHGLLAFKLRGGKTKSVRIRRVHIEEDPARIVHPGASALVSDYCLVDFSRSGTALVEIVTEPDFETPEEARAYVSEIQFILEYLGIVETGKEGAIRTDASISMEGGARVELKNLSGAARVEKALRAEVMRQERLRSLGQQVMSETRALDDASGATVTLRRKETVEDYGYIVEPDLPELRVDAETVERIKKTKRELPSVVAERIAEKYGLGSKAAQTIVYAGLAGYFEECVSLGAGKETAAKWICGDVLKCSHWAGKKPADALPPARLAELLKTLEKTELHPREAKELLKEMYSSGKTTADLRSERKKEAEGIDEAVSAVLAECAGVVEDFKLGKVKALDFLVGEVLKKTKATASPIEAREKLLAFFGEMKFTGKLPQTYA